MGSLQGISLCLVVHSSDPISWIQTPNHNSTSLPPNLQKFVYAGKQLQVGLLLKDYGITQDASLFLTYHLLGEAIGFAAPPHSHPDSFKEATKSRSSSLGPAFIVEQYKDILTIEVEDPHV